MDIVAARLLTTKLSLHVKLWQRGGHPHTIPSKGLQYFDIFLSEVSARRIIDEACLLYKKDMRRWCVELSNESILSALVLKTAVSLQVVFYR